MAIHGMTLRVLLEKATEAAKTVDAYGKLPCFSQEHDCHWTTSGGLTTKVRRIPITVAVCPCHEWRATQAIADVI